MKDGVVTNRMILDCRVSDANDPATKVERVILPSPWDVVHDTLMMKAHKWKNDSAY